MDFSKPVAINLKKLMKMVNPFDSSVWVNMKAPIKKSEVSDCIKSGCTMSPDTAKTECSAYLIWDTSTREQHIARVAWLVNNYRDDFPVDIDFGVPSHGCHFSVEDGHHRIAAAIFLQKKYIMVNASGSEDSIREYLV